MPKLKQGTTVVMVGPYVLTSDGYTFSSDETLSTSVVQLSKNGAAYAEKAGTEASVYDSSADRGEYRVFLTTVDSGTLGMLKLSAPTTACLPVWVTYDVVPTYETTDNLYTAAGVKTQVLAGLSTVGLTTDSTADALTTADLDGALTNYDAVIIGDLNNISATDVKTQAKAALSTVGFSTKSTADALTTADIDSGHTNYDAVLIGDLNNISATDVKTQAVAALSTVGLSTESTADALTTADIDAAFVDYAPSTFTTQDYDNLTSQIDYNSVKKGDSFEFDIVMIQSTDHRSPSSGDTVSGYYALDGSTFVALTTDSAITDLGYGAYHVALSTAETNANFSGSYRFTASGADARIVTFKITK